MQTAILKSVRFYNWRRSQVTFKRLNERNKLKNLTRLKGFVETIILILIVITYLRVPRVLHCIQFERLILVCSQFMLTGSAELFVLYNMIIYLSTSKIINLGNAIRQLQHDEQSSSKRFIPKDIEK